MGIVDDVTIQQMQTAVLVDNVGIPTFVQPLSYIKSLSNIYPAYIQNMSLSCFCPVFDLKIQFLSSANPVFVFLV